MNEIENITLKFSCDANWDDMHSVNGVKHCDLCQKKVYDFADAKQYEFLAILCENNNNVCGRFRPDQMASKPSSSRLPLRKWLSAAMVLIGINIFNNKAVAQTVNPKATQVNPTRALLVGDVAHPTFDKQASFPGGIVAFQKFIGKNIKYGKEMKEGKVFVTFSVRKDGSLYNYKVLKSPGNLNTNEVIRVLELSPKWNPATSNGKPVVSEFTIPVNFKK